MGLAGNGPRDWSPDDTTAARRTRRSRPSPSTRVLAGGRRRRESQVEWALPSRPTRAPRSGAWAMPVLGLVVLAASVIVVRDGPTTSWWYTTFGLVVAALGITTAHRIREGRRGSIGLAYLGTVLGIVATAIMLARWLSVSLVPALEPYVPTIEVAAPSAIAAADLGLAGTDASVTDDVAAPAEADAGIGSTTGTDANAGTEPTTGSGSAAIPDATTSPAQIAGTLAYLISAMPRNADLTEVHLSHGRILLPTGASVSAPGIRSFTITTAVGSSDYGFELQGQAGSTATFDSREGVVRWSD